MHLVFWSAAIVYIVALLNYRMPKIHYFDKEQLKKLYEKEKLTTYQIANKFGCCQATIWKKLIGLGIKRRRPHDLNSNVPSKETLIHLYLNKKLSTWEIGKKYKYSRGTVHRKLKEFGIVTRSRAEAHIIYPRNDFSGDLVEKAYLIGFRIGDLGVRKIYPNSKTICIASGSTIPEQIELIKNLFKKYGNVWVKKTKDGKINIQSNLNLSFEYLLSKNFPDWVEKNREYFFSFLAGFTDAEGTISQANKLDYYSLGNYDKQLLFIIYKNLNKLGIRCNVPNSDNRKGKTNSQGYKYSSNYWSLRIYRKKDLLNLLLKLKPYIRHKLKIKALKKAEDRIILRNARRNRYEI